MNFEYLVTTIWLGTLYRVIRTDGSLCSKEWFGEFCQYKCQCQYKTCRSDGSCNGTSCESGWFGYKCQYRNVLKHQNSWMTDGDDSTCYTDHDLKKVSLMLNDEHMFTWLRLTFKENEPIRYISLLFNTSIPCKHQRLSMVDNKTLDVWCAVYEQIQQIDITGEGVKTLCSVYVSGGRNVALKQPTSQTSSYFIGEKDLILYSQASNAVDGNTDGEFNHSTCTHTNIRDPSPTWTVRFNETFIINSFVVYNRNDTDPNDGDLRVRLKEFTLCAFGERNSTLLNYTDKNITPQTVYTINRFINESVKGVSISVGRNVQYGPILTLCEVEIFGDCPEDKKGLECSESCKKENNFCNSVCLGHNDPPACTHNCSVGMWGINCGNNCTGQCWQSNCDSTSGLCLSGCIGYNDPPYCIQNCSQNHWGFNCSQTCSVHCRNSTCDKQTGHCLYGCLPGFTGPACSKECEIGNWGLNCAQECNSGCFDRNCNKVNGLCFKGCNGFSDPPYCTVGCEEGFYGLNCIFNCSVNCENKNCKANDGACLNCAPGLDGIFCEIEDKISNDVALPPGGYLGIGIAVGIIISAVIFVLIGTFLLRKRCTMKKESSKKESTQHENHYDSLQFENTTNSTYEMAHA